MSFANERVQIAHHGFHPLVEHMGIDLRRGNIGVAEQFLHDAQIRTVLQKMACEGMAEHMRANPRGADSRSGGAGLEIAGESLAGEMPARAIGRKQPIASHPDPSLLLKCAPPAEHPVRDQRMASIISRTASVLI
jgi:hypothetical protein